MSSLERMVLPFATLRRTLGVGTSQVCPWQSIAVSLFLFLMWPHPTSITTSSLAVMLIAADPENFAPESEFS